MKAFWEITIQVHKYVGTYQVRIGDTGSPVPLIQKQGKSLKTTIRQALDEWLEAEHFES